MYNRSTKLRIWPYGFVTLTTCLPLSVKVGTNFADKRRSVGIVHSRTQATEFIFFSFFKTIYEVNKPYDSVRFLTTLNSSVVSPASA
jgi:hypothetical protein